MFSSRLIILFMVCLLCMGSGWARSTLIESTSVSSIPPTSSSLSEDATDSETISSERPRTEDRVPPSEPEAITDTKTITSASDSATSASTRSDTNTEGIDVSSSTESKTITRTITRSTPASPTTVHLSTKSDTATITSVSQSDNNTTMTLPNLTSNSSNSATPTGLSTMTRINSTSPSTTSPQPNATSTAGAYHQPGHCLVGSDCAWKLGVGLGFGGMFALTVLFFVSRRYRRHLAASHREHQANWNSRGLVLDKYGYPQGHQEAMKMVDTPDTRALSPQNGRFDELYLPGDVQKGVDRIVELQRQAMKTTVGSYGSVKRKPLPASAY